MFRLFDERTRAISTEQANLQRSIRSIVGIGRNARRRGTIEAHSRVGSSHHLRLICGPSQTCETLTRRWENFAGRPHARSLKTDGAKHGIEV